VPEPVVAAALESVARQSERVLSSVSDSAVVMVRDAAGDAGVLKVAATGKGIAGLRHEDAVLRTLRGDRQLGAWRDLLPAPLRYGDIDGGAYLLTSRLPGCDARALRPDWAPRLTRAAIEAIAPLHGLGRGVHTVDSRLLGQWVDEPAGLLREVVGDTRRLDRLVRFLYAQLDHRWVTLGWTHGDFHPGNLLVEDGRVTGIVDWSQAREHDLGAIDIACWLLTVPGPGQRRELGARVAARLARPRCWSAEESRMLHRHMLGDPVSGQAILLLAWLRHVAGNLAKSERYATSPLWSRRNIHPVVRRVAHG
jgi:aminoglycoside phosphotransferase (APT) family kinase protein